MEIGQLLETKRFKKEGSSVMFGTPKEYIQPFLDIIDGNQIDYIVKTGGTVTNVNEDETENISYGKIVVEAKLSTIFGPEYKETLGIVYALDTQKPVMKTYFGEEVTACTNLTVFGKADVFSQDILGNIDNIYSKVIMYFKNANQRAEEYKKMIDTMKSTELTYHQLENKIGALLMYGNRSRLGTSSVVKASNLLTDSKSKYFIGSKTDYRCTDWNLYNAVTDALHSADIVELPNKTVILSNFFGVN